MIRKQLNLYIQIAFLLSACLFYTSVSMAQFDDYYEVDEPEEFIEEVPIEPYYEPGDDVDYEAPPEPPDLNGNRPSFQIPRGNNRNNNINSPKSNFRANSNGEVQFQLADPPKYWVGERKPPIPKTPGK